MVSIVDNVLLGFLCALCLVNWPFAHQYITQFNEGPCPNMTGQQDFNITQILGYWIRIKQYNFIAVPYNLGDTRCIAHINILERTGNLTINLAYNKKDVLVNVYNQYLSAVPLPDEPERMNVSALNDGPEPYWNEWLILYSDENCYATYSCNNVNGTGDCEGYQHNEVALSVVCNPNYQTPQQIQPALDAIRNKNISTDELKDVDQRCYPWVDRNSE